MLIESDKEMIMYKRNEHAYRRYTEKRSVRKMRRCIPPNFPLEISYLCKARSFMSGDFAYTTNIINNRFFGWMGDSISHGTGSNIVKNYVNRSILYVLKKHRDHPDISFQTLIKESQQRFFSTYNVKKILKENLSDIIPRNDYQAKMSILIPIFFFQIREINQKLFFKFSNRGMPYCL
ncbi:MAG TPA: hypothetical protein VKS21_05695, partial [Spirochaetota bacterium]|nr:hypothetical protein [Spirochaetota bacterium]